jgi:hypothetical protein
VAIDPEDRALVGDFNLDKADSRSADERLGSEAHPRASSAHTAAKSSPQAAIGADADKAPLACAQ